MDAKDEMRLCPTCRMPISVLATRCRYCGEKVGRPRKEEEKLSINDLGGEQSTTYTLSGNVREALESFRVEVLGKNLVEEEAGGRASAKAAQPKAAHAKPGAAPTPPARKQTRTGNDAIDKHFDDLAELLEEEHSSSHIRIVQPTQPALTRRLFMLGGIIAGLVLLYVTTDYAWARIHDYMEERKRAQQPVYENHARSLLAQKKTVEAVAEANTALSVNDTPENRAVADDARAAFIAEIDAVLNAPKWSQDALRDASRKVTQVAQKDKSPAVLELMRRVDDDIAYYKIVLRQIDADGTKATFIVHRPGKPDTEETTGEGQYIADRFLVKKILPAQVRLEDTHVQAEGGYRQILCRIMSPAEPG